STSTAGAELPASGCSSPAVCARRRSQRRCARCVPSRSTSRRASRAHRGSRAMARSKTSSAAPKPPSVQPDPDGPLGVYGGRYVAETLMPALLELEAAWAKLRRDARFRREFATWLRDYAGRPTRLYFARRLSDRLGGARIYLKREDLLHTGAHKINNTIGQALLARRLGKTRLIAETRAGQHGVATATLAPPFGLPSPGFLRAHAPR